MILQILVFYNAWGVSDSTSNVTIRCEDYRAEINLDYGGNCISLTHLPTGIEVLRKPSSTQMLASSPLLYGMPMLFFPNRISNGRFMFEGREYVWPINEPERKNHIHGELYRTGFHVVSQSRTSIELEFIATRELPYLMFPHAFVLRQRYRVDSKGLHQEVTMTNNSDRNMPFGLAFHTTFKLPFIPGGDIRDVRLGLPIGREYLRDTTTLIPTGECLSNFSLRDALRGGTLQPNQHILSNFYSRENGKDMLLTDIKSGWSISYRADADYCFWMLWNGGRGDLLTVEPQTCLIDAFNVDRPFSEKGIIVIEPDSTIRLKTAIAVEKLPLFRQL